MSIPLTLYARHFLFNYRTQRNLDGSAGMVRRADEHAWCGWRAPPPSKACSPHLAPLPLMWDTQCRWVTALPWENTFTYACRFRAGASKEQQKLPRKSPGFWPNLGGWPPIGHSGEEGKEVGSSVLIKCYPVLQDEEQDMWTLRFMWKITNKDKFQEYS